MYKLEDGITQSILSLFLQCRQKCKNYLLGIRPLDERRDALEFGSAFHHLLELHHAGTLEDASMALNEWANSQKTPINPESLEQMLAGVLALWPQYKHVYKTRDKVLTWPAGSMEKQFDIVWCGHRLRGKIDGLPIVKGKVWQFETKTKGAIDEDVITTTLEFDFQNLFYYVACEEEGIKPCGVIYNIIRRPAYKYNGDPRAYQDKIEAAASEDPGHWFKRFEATYTKQQIERYKAELADKLNDFAAWVREEIPTYRNETACVGRGKCQYLGLCATGQMVGQYHSKGKLFEELS